MSVPTAIAIPAGSAATVAAPTLEPQSVPVSAKFLARLQGQFDQGKFCDVCVRCVVLPEQQQQQEVEQQQQEEEEEEEEEDEEEDEEQQSGSGRKSRKRPARPPRRSRRRGSNNRQNGREQAHDEEERRTLSPASAATPAQGADDRHSVPRQHPVRALALL